MSEKRSEATRVLCSSCGKGQQYWPGAGEDFKCRFCEEVGWAPIPTGSPRIAPEPPERSTVAHPAHYQEHPAGIECITVAEGFNFNLGNAIKYIWRAGLKGKRQEDLHKAAWYIQRELERLK